MIYSQQRGKNPKALFDEFKKAGGEARKVLVEQHAKNTGENVLFCYNVL